MKAFRIFAALALAIMLGTLSALGQTLTKKEAIDIANQLYELEMLSEKGKDFLLLKLNDEFFDEELEIRAWDIDGVKDSIGVLSASNLLIFLGRAFGSEFYFRTGFTEYERIMNEVGISQNPGDIDEEEREALMEKFWEQIAQTEGYKIEEAIADEEMTPDSLQAFTFSPLGIPQEEEYGLIHRKRSAAGKTCTRTLTDLHKVGLIDDIILAELKAELANHELIFEFIVVARAAERAVYYEDFERNKQKQIDYVHSLNEKGLISDDNLAKLINSYKGKAPKDVFDFVAYCNNAGSFQTADFSNDPEIAYASFFEEIKSIIPEFHYSNFKFMLEESEDDWAGDLTEIKARIIFEADGRTYENLFFYDYIRKDGSDLAEDTLLKLSTDFHKGVNKWLADQNSDKRLYYANKFEEGNAYGDDEFGLILMTATEHEAWGRSHTYFLSRESHDNTFNSGNIQKIVAQYDSIGVFTHLSESEMETAQTCLRESEIAGYPDILLCFPKTVVYFDWETGNLEDPYRELTNAFAEASRGNFTPENIIDEFEQNWEKETTYFAFDFLGKSYAENLAMDYDWLDYKFYELIEKAMKENDPDYGIYWCLDNGQAAGYIILNKEQHSYLQKHQPELFPKY